MTRRLDREPPAKTIKQLARIKWQSSGLTDSHARKLGFRALSGSQVRDLSSKFYEAGALLIPYWDLDGEPTKFYRIRYLEKLPGVAGLLEKPPRYSQQPVLQEAYYPPILVQSWRGIAADPGVEICLTEGELKAACACANGVPTMALGGVYSFMSAKRGVDLLPSLKEFEWSGRNVVIIYDNDLGDNPSVALARKTLSQKLLDAGAKIKYASLPPGPAKGVDDYIVQHGIEKYKKLLENAKPFLEGAALHDLNTEVVLIRSLDIVLEKSTEQIMFPDQFTRHLYANRHYEAEISKGSGKAQRIVFEKRPLAPRWMEWEGRSELQDLVYEPGKSKIIEGRAWNTWAGWGVTPKKGDIDPWEWLLDFLFADFKRERKYFEQWCAYPIQNPGAKMYTASVLWSRIKRLGKSFVGLALAKIYGENAIIIGPKQLKSEFNFWAKNRQLVVGEEITAGEARIDSDYLKYIITSPTVTINEKNKPQYVHDNHANFLFFSNHPDAIFLEDGDERYFIHGISHERPAARERYEAYGAWLNGDGPAHLMDHLLRLSTKGFNPYEHAPQTTSKFEMLVQGKTDVGLWVMRLREDPEHALKALGEARAKGCDLFTPDQLYHAMDPEGRARGRSSVASLGRHLAAAGFRQANGAIPVKTCTGLHRLYVARNPVRWDQATRREMREHFDQFNGPQVAGSVK